MLISGSISVSDFIASAPSSTAPGMAGDDADHWLANEMLWDELLRRRRHNGQPAAELVGRRSHEIQVGKAYVAAVLKWPRQQSGVDRDTHRMQLKLELGSNTEVAAATVESPEELRVFVFGRLDDSTISGHQRDRYEVVARQTEGSGKPAVPAAQREAGHASGDGTAARHNEFVCLGSQVKLSPVDSGAHPRRAPARVNSDVVHRSNINDQATVVRRHPCNRMPTSTYCDVQTPVGCIAQRLNNISGCG